MPNNPLDGVYRVGGVHADPFDVVNKLKNASSRREKEAGLIKEIK